MSDGPKFWWPHYEYARAYAGIAERFHRNRTLTENLEAIFSYLVDTLLTLCNYKYGAHLFLNERLGEGHYMAFSDHHQTPRPYAAADLDKASHARALEILRRHSSRHRGMPSIRDETAATLTEIAACFGTNVRHEASCLIIPFDFGRWDLGTFVLWGIRNEERELRTANDETLRDWIASYYNYLGTFLAREFTITEKTYLPSFYATRLSKVAILFADIRDFTPMTELIRHREGVKSVGLLQKILKSYCSTMASIIQKGERGRIDKFLGDGIMAVFGEHEAYPQKAVCRAIAAACEMVDAFDDLKKQYMDDVFHGPYEYEYNETVEPRLGIGINFGTVLFDYVGDSRHREYTAVGDHVNFAQRLEVAAARTDPETRVERPPILLSTTAYLCAKRYLFKKEELPLDPKGKGRKYTVYGIGSESFKHREYEESERTDNWM